MGSKSPPMILVMVGTLVCAAIIIFAAIAAALPTTLAIAQQEDTSLGEEDLGSGIASDILDNVGVGDEEQENDGAATAEDDDNSNRQLAAPTIDQDQGSANLALNEAFEGTVDRRFTHEPIPPTPPPLIENGKQLLLVQEMAIVKSMS